MKDPLSTYWAKRLDQTAEALDDNGFDVFRADDEEAVRRVALSEILPALEPRVIGLGGSLSVIQCGLYQALKEFPGLELLDT